MKKQAGEAAGEVKSVAEDLLKKAEEVINDISENETVKSVRAKVEELVSEENLKSVQQKVDGVLNDIAENETVKSVRGKIENAVEQLSSSETAQQAQNFVAEQAERAGDFLKESAESIENSELVKKLKDAVGLD